MGTHPIFESDFDCLTEMPFLKSLQVKKEPLWHTWDREAQKEGLRDTVYFVNGDYYCGEWHNNKRDGLGVMTYKKEKTQYTGDWKNDKKEGEGILAKFINNTYKEMITKVSRTFLVQKFDWNNVVLIRLG